MSSILKALKKLEDEKTARKPDSINIDAEILRGDTSHRISLLGVSLVAGLLFVCGSGATYIYMKRGGGTIPEQRYSAPAVVPAERSASASPPNAPVVPDASQALQNGSHAAEIPRLEPVSIPGPQHRSAKASPPPAVSQKQPVKTRSPQPLKSSVAAPAVHAAAAGMAPLFRVNGIAFQDGGADSVAVVNGISVANGSVIEGARVEDIQKDRVRFSYGGENFDVALGKSNR